MAGTNGVLQQQSEEKKERHRVQDTYNGRAGSCSKYRQLEVHVSDTADNIRVLLAERRAMTCCVENREAVDDEPVISHLLRIVIHGEQAHVISQILRVMCPRRKEQRHQCVQIYYTSACFCASVLRGGMVTTTERKSPCRTTSQQFGQQ